MSRDTRPEYTTPARGEFSFINMWGLARCVFPSRQEGKAQLTGKTPTVLVRSHTLETQIHTRSDGHSQKRANRRLQLNPPQSETRKNDRANTLANGTPLMRQAGKKITTEDNAKTQSLTFLSRSLELTYLICWCPEIVFPWRPAPLPSDLTGGANTSQNRRVSSPAPDTTVRPSGDAAM